MIAVRGFVPGGLLAVGPGPLENVNPWNGLDQMAEDITLPELTDVVAITRLHTKTPPSHASPPNTSTPCQTSTWTINPS